MCNKVVLGVNKNQMSDATNLKSLDWKLTLGEKSLAAPGTRTLLAARSYSLTVALLLGRGVDYVPSVVDATWQVGPQQPHLVPHVEVPGRQVTENAFDYRCSQW